MPSPGIRPSPIKSVDWRLRRSARGQFSCDAQIPRKYVASVEFNIPYESVKLVEPFQVHVDHDNQRQRLSYYSGADVYINRFDVSTGNSTQWTVFPVQFALACGVSTYPGGTPLTNVFPNMALFQKQVLYWCICSESCSLLLLLRTALRW